MPNAFSPNGDGRNDFFGLRFPDISCIESLKLIVFNRWGEKVFETSNPLDKWDGSFHGKIENTAAFAYYVNIELPTGEKIIKKGFISLIR